MLLKIVLFILWLFVLITMSSVMIIFERDKPRTIIMWLALFLCTSLVGGIIYLSSKVVYYKKRNSLKVKVKEDEIYQNLISKYLLKDNNTSYDEYFTFNQLGYNANVFENNSCEFFHTYGKFQNNLMREIATAKSYIIFEVTQLKAQDLEWLKQPLIDKLSAGVVVKIIYDKSINRKFKRELVAAGAKVYKFSKLRTLDHKFVNRRNSVVIDGNIAYLGKIDLKPCQAKEKCIVSNMIVKFKGEVVQDIDLSAHKDIIFASGKYMDYTTPKFDTKTQVKMQYLSNTIEQGLDLALIKAICMAKESIQIQVEEFIPTESIMALLKFALNSNIEIKLMIPMKAEAQGRYYASRAYAKELALYGASCYLYDGYIRFNSIVIDSHYGLYGSFTLNQGLINESLQDVMIIDDEKAVAHLNKTFDVGVDNSYRINDAKYLLLKEKFFKNFV